MKNSKGNTMKKQIATMAVMAGVTMLTVAAGSAHAGLFGTTYPHNIMYTTCDNKGVASLSVPYAGGVGTTNTIQKLNDGTLVSKNDFDLGMITEIIERKQYVVDDTELTVFYNPAVPMLAINKYELRGREAYTTITILAPAQKAEIDEIAGNADELLNKICGEEPRTAKLNCNKNQWYRGIYAFLAHAQLNYGTGYEHDYQFQKMLKKHIAGLTILKKPVRYQHAPAKYFDHKELKGQLPYPLHEVNSRSLTLPPPFTSCLIRQNWQLYKAIWTSTSHPSDS
jgi:hypothetical protein